MSYGGISSSLNKNLNSIDHSLSDLRHKIEAHEEVKADNLDPLIRIIKNSNKSIEKLKDSHQETGIQLQNKTITHTTDTIAFLQKSKKTIEEQAGQLQASLFFKVLTQYEKNLKELRTGERAEKVDLDQL